MLGPIRAPGRRYTVGEWADRRRRQDAEEAEQREGDDRDRDEAATSRDDAAFSVTPPRGTGTRGPSRRRWPRGRRLWQGRIEAVRDDEALRGAERRDTAGC